VITSRQDGELAARGCSRNDRQGPLRDGPSFAGMLYEGNNGYNAAVFA